MARRTSRTTPNLRHQPLRGAGFERAHSSVVLSEHVRDQRRGFTIVELLIVVVVIAILAAITVVAYNGINNRAKASAASSAAQQAAKKVMTYAVTNAEQYPGTLSDAGVSDSGSTTYQYRVDNSANPATFCLTATSQNVSYWVSSTAATPSAGACAGHGVDGVPPITNLVLNPSVEVNRTGLGSMGGVGDRTISQEAVPDAVSGDYVLRLTVGASGGIAGYASTTGVLPVGTYTGSLWIRSSIAVRVNPYFEGTAARSTVSGQSANLVPGQWSRVWLVVNTTSEGTLRVGFLSGGAGTAPEGTRIEVDGFMLVEGVTVQAFADGNSPGWAWNGTAGNSTSTGPAL